jgi:hypothetical protein
MKLLLGIALLISIILAGCLAPGGCGPPGQNQTYSQVQLKYLLLDHYNESRFFFCDPDYYPVGHGDELEKAIAIFPVIRNSTEEFDAIVEQKGLQPPYSDESKLIIYREYKKLNAIPLSPVTTDSYAFSLQIQTDDGGRRMTGTIRTDGCILEEQSIPAFLTCPVCLAGGTFIDTPDGPVAVEELGEGMPVWTRDPDGSPMVVPVLRTVKTPVPPWYWCIHLRLADGREISASPGHPTLDNRTLGMLHAGDELDGGVVVGTDSVFSGGGFTYDILPAGDTRSYWANGLLLKSTLL